MPGLPGSLVVRGSNPRGPTTFNLLRQTPAALISREVMRTEAIKVKIGSKEIELTDDMIKVLRTYVRTNMTLEQLASALSLESWEEAYELVKNVPSWVLRKYIIS